MPKHPNFLLKTFAGLLICAGLVCGCAVAPAVLPILPSATPTQANTPLPTSLPSPTPLPATLTPNPQPTPSATPCGQMQGQVQRMSINADFFSKPLYFQLYLPPCYSAHPAHGYPVLYLLHGQSSNDSLWLDLGVVKTADQLITSGEVQPFIMLLPYEEYSLQDPNESVFGRLVTEKLLPWVDQNYATCTERACRAIGGLSRGAAWAVHLGFDQWQQFGAIGAHSLPPFWGDSARLPVWLQGMPPKQFPALYLDIGQEDIYFQAAAGFEALLSRSNVPHVWQVNPGAHEFGYWKSHVAAYLRWYAAQWPQTP